MEPANRKKVIFISLVQLAASVLLIFSLARLGMVPTKYLITAAVVLTVLFAGYLGVDIYYMGDLTGIKVASALISMVLFAAAYFVCRTAGTVETITGDSGSSVKIDRVVVAVSAGDPAETLEDGKNYRFGVQYALKGEEITDTVSEIDKELGKEIDTFEYANIQEQIQGLYDGGVQAVILNEAYLDLLEEEFEDIRTDLKIIYTRDVEKEVELPKNQEEVQTEKESFIVYISGIDVYGSIKKTSRSDVNILAVVNPASHQILLVTTPRDYYIEFPGVTGGTRDKLTHAGIYGVDVSMAALGALYDIEPDFYARVNFTSLVNIVDALGGVDVYSEYAFTIPNGVQVSKGINHFDGEQALAFSRERKQLPGGDFQRGKNQQAVITGMIQKAVSPAILKGAGTILESISGNVDTNMTASQIRRLVKEQLDHPASWNIKSMAAEGKGDSQRCYSMPGRSLYVAWPVEKSVEQIKEAIAQVQSGEVLSDSLATE